jgi:uncharacterized protein (TIGR02147 family)
MEAFREYLKQEYTRRANKNPHYSLRAFAKNLGVHHATLSTLLSGKRAVTKSSVLKLSRALGLSPEETRRYLKGASTKKSNEAFHQIESDTYASISEWYFDAILELSLIKAFKLEPSIIASSIGITPLQAKIALETLTRLGFLTESSKGGLELTHPDSTNILHPELTSVAQKRNQKSIMEKSIEAIDNVAPALRDHTSLTVAMNADDLPEVKKMIGRFRRQLNAYVQRPTVKPDQVYQLQVSFFPLTKSENPRSSK